MSASWRNWTSAVLAGLLVACAGPIPGPGSGPEAGGAAPGQDAVNRVEAATAIETATDAADDRQIRQRFEQGLALSQAEQWVEAAAVFRGLTRDVPDRLGPWVNLGIALARQGLDEQALAVLREAVKRDPKHARAQHEVAIVMRRTGHFQEARAAYEAALAAEPDFALAHRNLGLLCELYLHDLPCALQHYEQYQSLDAEADQEVELWIVDVRRRIGD